MSIYNRLILFQFILYDFLQSQPDPNPIEIFTPINLVMFSFTALFFYCQCGEFVMNEFDEFDDELYRCKWYLFPIEIRRMLVIVMINTQKPLKIRGFFNTVCTREAFKIVSILISFLCCNDFASIYAYV